MIEPYPILSIYSIAIYIGIIYIRRIRTAQGCRAVAVEDDPYVFAAAVPTNHRVASALRPLRVNAQRRASNILKWVNRPNHIYSIGYLPPPPPFIFVPTSPLFQWGRLGLKNRGPSAAARESYGAESCG